MLCADIWNEASSSDQASPCQVLNDGPWNEGPLFPIGVMVKMLVGAKAENTPGWSASSSQGPKISLNIVIKFCRLFKCH